MSIFNDYDKAITIVLEIWTRGTCTTYIYDYHQAISLAIVKEEARKG
jgi:hypothetical protein